MEKQTITTAITDYSERQNISFPYTQIKISFLTHNPDLQVHPVHSCNEEVEAIVLINLITNQI